MCIYFSVYWPEKVGLTCSKRTLFRIERTQVCVGVSTRTQVCVSVIFALSFRRNNHTHAIIRNFWKMDEENESTKITER